MLYNVADYYKEFLSGGCNNKILIIFQRTKLSIFKTNINPSISEKPH